jgi:hypothetical protein
MSCSSRWGFDGRHVKKLLRWPTLPCGELPEPFASFPTVKAWIDDERRNALPPVQIPKECYESQKKARDKLMLQSLGVRQDDAGDASIGDIRIDADQMFLSEVEATGTVFTARGLLPFMESLWIAGSPYRSETRLNRFLIKLGRAFASTKKRKSLPDWLQNVDQTERFIVEGWCETIYVDGERWPSLCCFTTPALVKFQRLCNVKHCKLGTKDSRTIERAIQRLGLVRVPRGRIRHVEKKFGEFRFG